MVYHISHFEIECCFLESPTWLDAMIVRLLAFLRCQDLDMPAGQLRIRGVDRGQLFECAENIQWLGSNMFKDWEAWTIWSRDTKLIPETPWMEGINNAVLELRCKFNVTGYDLSTTDVVMATWWKRVRLAVFGLMERQAVQIFEGSSMQRQCFEFKSSISWQLTISLSKFGFKRYNGFVWQVAYSLFSWLIHTNSSATRQYLSLDNVASPMATLRPGCVGNGWPLPSGAMILPQIS